MKKCLGHRLLLLFKKKFSFLKNRNVQLISSESVGGGDGGGRGRVKYQMKATTALNIGVSFPSKQTTCFWNQANDEISDIIRHGGEAPPHKGGDGKIAQSLLNEIHGNPLSSIWISLNAFCVPFIEISLYNKLSFLW